MSQSNMAREVAEIPMRPPAFWRNRTRPWSPPPMSCAPAIRR